MDESKPHANGNKISRIVSQTQMGTNDSYADSDHKERPITESSDGPQYDEIAKSIKQYI